MTHNHTENQFTTSNQEVPDANLASYWLWLGVLLLLLVAGRANNRPAVGQTTRHLPATISRPNSKRSSHAKSPAYFYVCQSIKRP